MAKKQELQDKRFELYERAHTKEYYAVAKWLSEVKFSSAVFGVDPVDVWRKIEKLCELYEAALDAERARNAKLERKLRSLSSGKSEAQETREQLRAASAKPEISVSSVTADFKAAEHEKKENRTESAPVKVQQQKESAKQEEPAKVAPAPRKQERSSSQEELILQELLRELGPKGGEPNG